jgi:hypothetical protein
MEIANNYDEVFVCKIESKISNGLIVHEFIIKPKGIDTYEQYQFEVTCIPNGISIVSNMQNNDCPLVSKKGISYLMIDYAHEAFGKNLHSSTNSEKHKLISPEFITPEAEIIWKRLCGEGKAIFCNSTYRYKCI